MSKSSPLNVSTKNLLTCKAGKSSQIKAESNKHIADLCSVIFKAKNEKMSIYIEVNYMITCLCNCPLDEQIFTIIQKREQCAQVVPTADMVPNSIFTPTRSNFVPLRLGSMWCIIQAHHMSLSVNPSIFTKLCQIETEINEHNLSKLNSTFNTKKDQKYFCEFSLPF